MPTRGGYINYDKKKASRASKWLGGAQRTAVARQAASRLATACEWAAVAAAGSVATTVMGKLSLKASS